MSTLQPSLEEKHKHKDDGDGRKLDGKQTASSFLLLTTTPPDHIVQDVKNENLRTTETLGWNDGTAKDDTERVPGPEATPTNAGLPPLPMKQKLAAEPTQKETKEHSHDRIASTSSIWTSAAATLKNLVVGKPQSPSKDIVTVVPDPRTAPERGQNAQYQSIQRKLNKGKEKATNIDASPPPPTAENVLPVLGPPERPTQSYDSKSKTERRPSGPPLRLSSIAHSLPTTSSHPPVSSRQSTMSSSSIRSPNSTISNTTATSATSATDEENQAAALAALNAVIHSVGTGYTQPLTSRAAQLHANDQMLAQQREKLLQTSALLAKDTEALRKLAVESNNKLKGFGDLKNWSETLEGDLNAIEETLRLVEHGALETCAKCEMGIDEEEEQRWCGECGKGFHLTCAGEDPDDLLTPAYGPGLGDDDNHVNKHQNDMHNPATVALPGSLPSTSSAHQPRDLAAMSSLFSAFTPAATVPQASVPSVPKPSSMFEWGGIPDNLRLEDEVGDGSESGSSEWSEEDWRCQECRLKDDLDAIGRGL